MPTVSIGVPVYNGERFVAEALESLLGQSFGDLEIVISDNASTDGTQEICRRVAALDGRVRYHRNERNVGAAGNFNLAFARSSGEYFKWAAADDLCAREFVERTAAVLRNDPSVALAYPQTTVIDEHSRAIEDYRFSGPTDSVEIADRFGALLGSHRCYQVFGLIRRCALERTRLIGPYRHGDGVLLAHLALMGRFVQIDEPLFFARQHPGQSMTLLDDDQKYAAWFNPGLDGKMVFPFWRLTKEGMRLIASESIPLPQRLRCFRALLTSEWMSPRNLIGDVRSQLSRSVTRRAPRFAARMRGKNRSVRLNGN